MDEGTGNVHNLIAKKLLVALAIGQLAGIMSLWAFYLWAFSSFSPGWVYLDWLSLNEDIIVWVRGISG